MSCPDDPPKLNNRPGLPALAYRIGDYHSFRERLIQRLNCPLVTPEQPQGVSLSPLTTRASDDPAIAILDACAIVADVLTFYQERIINEGYLLTATERRSVLELARMISYELNPGVAASTLLAFKVDDAPGSPSVVTIPKGTQIQSVPGQDELPQTFETVEEFIARLDWNALKPRPTRSQVIMPSQPLDRMAGEGTAQDKQAIAPSVRQLYLDGTTTQLQAGDLVLLMEKDRKNSTRYLLTLDTVETNSQKGYTLVTWKRQIPAEIEQPIVNPTLLVFRQRAALFGHNAPKWEEQSDDVKRKSATQSGDSIQGGVFLTPDDGRTVQPMSKGLPNQDIRCLAVSKIGNLFAGTPSGIFRSKDNGATWVAVNTGLSNLNLQTIFVDQQGTLLVGTAEGGVFRSKDEAESWTPIHLGSIRLDGQNTANVRTVNTGLPNTVIRSLLAYATPTPAFSTAIGSATIVAGTTITIEGDAFPTGLQVGSPISAAEQTAFVTAINSYTFTTLLIVNTAFTSEVSLSTSQFTISAPQNSNVLTITGTTLLSEFKVDQDITIAGTTRTITNIQSYRFTAELTVNAAFTPVIPPKTSFFTGGTYLFAGTDDGLFFSVDQGKNWYPRSLQGIAVRSLILGQNGLSRVMFAGTDSGVFRSTTDGATWEGVNNPGLTANDALDVYPVQVVNGVLLAGSKRGIFRLNPSDNTWNLYLSTQMVRSLLGYRRGNSDYLAVATDDGSFVCEFANPQSTKRSLTTWGTNALAGHTALKALVIGTQFVGVVPAQTVGTGAVGTGAAAENPGLTQSAQPDWFNFQIKAQELDLDTLYPKILVNSWVVLVDGDRAAVRVVKQTAPAQLVDFGLTGTVTRMIPDAPVDSGNFNRRSTLVLAQSEALKLAGEPLTVQTQQTKIFLDPVQANEIFLSQYVTGLQPQQGVIVSGKRIRAKFNHIGGIFRREVEGDRWVRSSVGLTNTDVAAFVTGVKPATGQISRDRTALIGTNTAFTQQLKANDRIVIANTQATIQAILSDSHLLLQPPFSQEIPPDTSFTYEVARIGTIATDLTILEGSNTRFLQELLPGTQITVATQNRTVRSIQSDTELVMDEGLDLPGNTPFTYTRSGTGEIVRDRTFIQGTGTNFQTLQLGRQIIVDGTQTRTIQRIESDTLLQVDRALDLGTVSVGFTYTSSGTGQVISRFLSRTDDIFDRGDRLFNFNFNFIVLAGVGTRFTQELQQGSLITINNQTVTVQQIRSDTLLFLDRSIQVSDLTPFTYRNPGNGTIANLPTAIRGENTRFTSELQVGSRIAVGEQTRAVTQIASETLLFVDQPVDLPTSHSFLYTNSGTGAIATNRSLLVGSNTRFSQTLNIGDRISIIGQPPRTITQVNSDTSLRVDAAFPSTVPPDTSFTSTVQGRGTLESDRTAILGQGTTFTQDFQVGMPLQVSDQIQTITRINSDTSLSIDAPFNPELSTPIAFGSSVLWVGTEGGGVFRSTNHGETWEPLNQGLTDLQIQTLMLQPDPRSPWGGRLVAGTANGIFLSVDGEHWETTRTGGIPLNVRVLLDNFNRNEMLAGVGKAGLFRSADGGKTWTQTALSNTDVQALAIAPDGTIWAGTINDGVFCSSDGGATWQAIAQGLTNPNVTALLSYGRETLEVLAGTAGSGIFRLKTTSVNDGNDGLDGLDFQWEPVPNNPADLHIRCLSINLDTQRLLAGTASGGIFDSMNGGNGWSSFNLGLTSTDIALNPLGKVNTDVRAIACLDTTLFAAGMGLLISPDALSTAPIRSGDRAWIMAPPQPLPQSDPELARAATRSTQHPDPGSHLEQKWLLRDRNGFVGVVFSTHPDDIGLEPAASDDAVVSELGIIQAPPDDQQQPILRLVDPIQNSYDPATVSIYANIVKATHGETVPNEVIGSGAGNATHQSFVLQKPPLTFVSAIAASGATSTLQVRVNGILWQNVFSLYQQSPQAQVYMTRLADDGTVTITFGDGESGARLPSGEENIVATYRSGIGLAGNLEADKLTLLNSRPLGISEVNNPLSATGAADPETMAEARESAPRTVRTLDRIVSLQDYEDFARAFVGIGKAKATVLWTGQIQQIQITIAAIGGATVPPGTALFDNLVQAIDAARDPVQQVQVESYESMLFNLEARLLIDPAYLADPVLAQVHHALMQRFTFIQRDFGQAVTLSEAIAVIQSVLGVIAVDLDALYCQNKPRNLGNLEALFARWDSQKGQVLPAQLLSINPVGIRLSVETTL